MILYFSGTGNSAAIAEMLARKLDETAVIHLAGRQLLDATVNVSAAERIIYVMPVYSWGIPPVIVDFIRNAAINGAEKACHHLVLTCGDDAGLTHLQWRRLIKARGWNDVSAHTVIMPNTYTLMKGFDVDNADVEKRKLDAAPAAVDKIAADIIKGESVDKVIKGRFAWIKSRIIYPWFRRYAMNPRPFHADELCISCGKCARQCPMLNISMEGRRPSWGDRCALCLRCYHICPAHAVQYGNKTQGKGQYICPLKS